MNENKRQQARTQGRFDYGTRSSSGRKSDSNLSQKSGHGGSNDCSFESSGGQSKASSSFPSLDRPPAVEEIREPGKRVLSISKRGESSILFEPSFIPQEKANDLFKTLLKNVDWGSKKIVINGEEKPQPRLVAWFGPLPYAYSGLTLKAKVMPDDILNVKRDVEHVLKKRGIDVELNSVLLNLYRDEKDSVAWHSDDELSMGICPTIASVSLGQSRRFQLRRKTEDKYADAEYVVHLDNGSLIVMDGVMQDYWEHRVPKEYHQRRKRINLTFRTVYAIDSVQRPLAPVPSFPEKNYVFNNPQDPFHFEEEAFPSLANNTLAIKPARENKPPRWDEPNVKQKSASPRSPVITKAVRGASNWSEVDSNHGEGDWGYSEKDYKVGSKSQDKKKSSDLPETPTGDWGNYTEEAAQMRVDKHFSERTANSEKIHGNFKSSNKQEREHNDYEGGSYRSSSKDFSKGKENLKKKNTSSRSASELSGSKEREGSQFKENASFPSLKQLSKGEEWEDDNFETSNRLRRSNDKEDEPLCKGSENYASPKESFKRNGSYEKKNLHTSRSFNKHARNEYEEPQHDRNSNFSSRKPFPKGGRNQQTDNSFRSSNRRRECKDYGEETGDSVSSNQISKENGKHQRSPNSSRIPNDLPDSKEYEEETQVQETEQLQENGNFEKNDPVSHVSVKPSESKEYEEDECKGSVMSVNVPEFHSSYPVSASKKTKEFLPDEYEENHNTNSSSRKRFSKERRNQQTSDSFSSSNKHHGNKDNKEETVKYRSSNQNVKHEQSPDSSRSPNDQPDSKEVQEKEHSSKKFLQQNKNRESDNFESPANSELSENKEYEESKFKGSVMSVDVPEFQSKYSVSDSKKTHEYSAEKYGEDYRLECTKLERIYYYINEHQWEIPFSRRDNEELKVLFTVVDCAEGPLPIQSLIAICTRMETIVRFAENRPVYSENSYNSGAKQTFYPSKTYRRYN